MKTGKQRPIEQKPYEIDIYHKNPYETEVGSQKRISFSPDRRWPFTSHDSKRVRRQITERTTDSGSETEELPTTACGKTFVEEQSGGGCCGEPSRKGSPGAITGSEACSS
jgi:hypothetical protein